MRIRYVALALAVVAIVAVVSIGCDRGVRLAGPSETGQTIITDILTGIVAAPVNAVAQRTVKTFTIGQGGGPVTVTLTSAVQTRPDGTVQATVTMGLGAGTFANGTCTIGAGSSVSTLPGTAPQLSGNLTAGTYCIEVSDVSGQVGPVAFSVTVIHT